MTTVTGKWKKNCKFQTGSNSERSQDLMEVRLNISACDEVKHSSDTWLPYGTWLPNRSQIVSKSKEAAWVVHGC